MYFFPRTWISLQLALNEVVGEWTELFHSTYRNIIVIRFLSFFIQFIVHLHHRKVSFKMASRKFLLGWACRKRYIIPFQNKELDVWFLPQGPYGHSGLLSDAWSVSLAYQIQGGPQDHRIQIDWICSPCDGGGSLETSQLKAFWNHGVSENKEKYMLMHPKMVVNARRGESIKISPVDAEHGNSLQELWHSQPASCTAGFDSSSLDPSQV
jgi:hypothetical protein